MRRTELKLESWIKEQIFGFCSGVSYRGEEAEYHTFIRSIMRKAHNTEEFVNLFLSNENAKFMYSYQLLFKEFKREKLWYYIRGNFADKSQKILHSYGELTVGTKDFCLKIDGGGSDGAIRFAVLEYDEFYCAYLMYLAEEITLSGAFNIYNSEKEIVTTLQGMYKVYTFEGLIAFIKY